MGTQREADVPHHRTMTRLWLGPHSCWSAAKSPLSTPQTLGFMYRIMYVCVSIWRTILMCNRLYLTCWMAAAAMTQKSVDTAVMLCSEAKYNIQYMSTTQIGQIINIDCSSRYVCLKTFICTTYGNNNQYKVLHLWQRYAVYILQEWTLLVHLVYWVKYWPLAERLVVAAIYLVKLYSLLGTYYLYSVNNMIFSFCLCLNFILRI